MTLRVLTLVAVLVSGFAFGQGAETQTSSLYDELRAVLVVDDEQANAEEEPGEEEESPWSTLKGGQAYCRLDFDSGRGTTALCFTEYNLIDLEIGGGHARLGVGAEYRLLPAWEATPVVMVEYIHELWFAGVEVGTSVLGNGDGIRFGASAGVPIP